MSCPKCNAEVPPNSAFCSRCGAALALSSPAPAAAPSSAEPEQELWIGRFSGQTLAHDWILWVLWVGVLVYAWFALITPPSRQQPVFRWTFLAAVGVPFLAILWSVLVQKLTIRYRLTTHRLFKDTGIFSRNLNEIELIRVDDVAVRQNLIQRIFNVGTVTVIAPTDATEPRIELVGIADPIEVKERIRSQVRKRRERSIHLEQL